MTAVDPDALAEAYEFYTETGDPVVNGRLGQAARAVLEAPTAEWCEVHEASSANPHHCLWTAVVDDRESCKIGRVRLVAEEET